MTQQPVRRQHRLLPPTVLPKPIPDADLVAFFHVIDSVRDRLIVTVQVDEPRLSCQSTSLSRKIRSYEHAISVATRDVGSTPRCRAGLYPRPRSPYSRLRGHRPALNRAPPAALTQLLTASIE